MGQREAKCRVIWQLRQIHADPRHETSLIINGWPKPALWTQCGALVSGRMIPEREAHDSGEGNIFSVRRFLPFAKKFAILRPGMQTRHPLVGSVLPRGIWNTRNFVRATVVLADRGQRLPRSSLGVSDLFLGRAGRPKPGRFGDSFWRRPWPCAVRTRPLPRRGYCDARRLFVHHQICNTCGRGCHTGAWRSSIRVPC